MSFLSECIEKLSDFNNIQSETIENSTTIADGQVEYLESIIENRLEIENGVICEVRIEYEIDDNNSLQYLMVDVYISEKGEISTEEVKRIVKEYLDCQVSVYE